MSQLAGPECLQNLMESLLWEQRVRAINTAVSCPYISQIRRLIVLCNRHLIAVIRYYKLFLLVKLIMEN